MGALSRSSRTELRIGASGLLLVRERRQELVLTCVGFRQLGDAADEFRFQALAFTGESEHVRDGLKNVNVLVGEGAFAARVRADDAEGSTLPRDRHADAARDGVILQAGGIRLVGHVLGVGGRPFRDADDARFPADAGPENHVVSRRRLLPTPQNSTPSASAAAAADRSESSAMSPPTRAC